MTGRYESPICDNHGNLVPCHRCARAAATIEQILIGGAVAVALVVACLVAFWGAS